MEIKRREDQKWHFANGVQCGWADKYAREDQFTTTKKISSESDVPADFCGECQKRRSSRD
jgi:sulfur relay (sulfurtransferase) complex TusBCD TusD component (DsrE family)